MARSQCTACKETSSSESAFNKHRTGSYGDPIYDESKHITGYTQHERKCLTEAEMLAKKMVKNESGIWITKELDRAILDKVIGQA